MKIKRRDTWRQNNPADQMVAVLSAISGYAHSLGEGMYPKKNEAMMVGAKLLRLTEQLYELVKLLPPTEWPGEPDDQGTKAEGG